MRAPTIARNGTQRRSRSKVWSDDIRGSWGELRSRWSFVRKKLRHGFVEGSCANPDTRFDLRDVV
jgi:hypothetical protein